MIPSLAANSRSVVADVIDEVMDGDCGGPKKGNKFASFDHHGSIFTALLL